MGTYSADLPVFLDPKNISIQLIVRFCDGASNYNACRKYTFLPASRFTETVEDEFVLKTISYQSSLPQIVSVRVEITNRAFLSFQTGNCLTQNIPMTLYFWVITQVSCKFIESPERWCRNVWDASSKWKCCSRTDWLVAEPCSCTGRIRWRRKTSSFEQVVCVRLIRRSYHMIRKHDLWQWRTCDDFQCLNTVVFVVLGQCSGRILSVTLGLGVSYWVVWFNFRKGT